MNRRAALGCLLFTCCVAGVAGFPSGATVEACGTLLPRHLRTSPKPPADSPFTFVASSGQYLQDSRSRKIKVSIDGARFRGFLVVAVDEDTDERIGSWMHAPGMYQLPCAGITHSDGHAKIAVHLIWTPPEDKKFGNVTFLGTILESFSSYYSGLVASLDLKSKKKKKLLLNSESDANAGSNHTLIDELLQHEHPEENDLTFNP